VQPALYRRLSEFLDRFAGERHVSRAVWARRLFEALDWGERAAFSIERTTDTEFDLHAEGCPLLTVLSASPEDVTTVYRGLNRAYNRDVPWLIATDVEALGLFGSYWVSFPTDISSALAWELRSNEFLLEAPKLNLLTPHEVARNELNELYALFPMRRKRHPIDVHLVDRMSHWREMALSALGETEGGDDRIVYRFINSLFLVRYLEDSHLSDNSLLDLMDLSRTDLISHLRRIFRSVRESINYPTIRYNDLQRLEPAPLKTLFSELYAYREWGVEYDFAAMSVDVLGRFYEEYLRLKPQRVTLTPRQRATIGLFDSPTHKLADVRQEKGIFYTPPYVVNYIVGNLVRRHEAAQRQTPPLVMDLACGSGSFLVAALGEIRRRERWAAEAPQSVVGFDNDDRAIEAARFNLVAKCLADRVPTPVPDLRLYTYNLLENGPAGELLQRLLDERTPDLIVGNPPYISYERLASEYDVQAIRRSFRLAAKRTDSYMLFVEAAIQLLRPGGFCGLVLPNVFMRSSSAGPLRAWLVEHADVLELIDFQDQPVFQNVGIYVCILLLRKKGVGKNPPRVTVGKIYQLSPSPATQLARLGVSQQAAGATEEVFQAEQPKGTQPWLFRNPEEESLLQKLRNSSVTFAESGLDIFQGIKTGLDDVFVLDSSDAIQAVEAEITVPFIRGRDLTRWSTRVQSRVIYPYDRGTGATMPWSRIQTKYPKCAAYLESRRPELTKRRSRTGEKWYELIRPRVQSVLTNSPKLFLAELTLRPRVAISSEQDAAIAGGTGGGSVILLQNAKYERYSLLAFLNSSVSEWIARQTASVRRGGWILIEQASLRALPIPRFLSDSESFARSELARLGEAASVIAGQGSDLKSTTARQRLAAIEDQIDSLVMEAAGLNAQHGAYIRQRIRALHGPTLRNGEDDLL
jgi:type I restriction-modification system DNA methylase subunit